MPRKVRARNSHGERNAVYVYCIGREESLVPLCGDGLPEAIEHGSALELVSETGLAAVTSQVPLDDYSERALESRLGDPTWTAIRAMRHEKVVEHFASRASVVPLRFGTIYLRRDRVAKMLVDKGAEIAGLVDRLRGRQEWGLTVYRDRDKLTKAIITLSPRLRDLGREAASASPGRSYLLQKMIEKQRLEETRKETARVLEELEQKLAPLSESVAHLRILKDEASEHGEVAAKLAFLVSSAAFSKFRGAAERLAGEHAALGFKLELTGPWPAYSFSALPERVAERGAGDRNI